MSIASRHDPSGFAARSTVAVAARISNSECGLMMWAKCRVILAQTGACEHFELQTLTRVTADLQPHLLGELVELRPLREDDWETLFQVASDPTIWEQHPNSDRHRKDVFRTFFREAIDSGRGAGRSRSKDATHHRIVAVRLVRQRPAHDRNRLDVPGSRLLGRTIQPRDESVDASTRIHLCTPRRLRDRTRRFYDRAMPSNESAQSSHRIAKKARMREAERSTSSHTKS